MKKALYVTDSFDRIYSDAAQREIGELVEILAPPQPKTILETAPELLARAEIILSGWGAPKLDRAFLDAAPKLEAFFYGAGSIRGIVTDAFWNSGIVITSSWQANGVPVAEFTIAQIILALKFGHRSADIYKQRRSADAVRSQLGVPPGACGGMVGIISLGMIGRMVAERLKSFDLTVIAHDPFASAEQAEVLGVELVSLDDIFARSDVVSLHAPWLPETENMIRGRHFRAMKPGATFINTARGAIVDEPEMIAALEDRPDITAALDVTFPEPPADDSPLWEMPNVILTPHIAGAMGNECHRMSRLVADDLKRYINGEPLKHQVTREQAKTLA